MRNVFFHWDRDMLSVEPAPDFARDFSAHIRFVRAIREAARGHNKRVLAVVTRTAR